MDRPIPWFSSEIYDSDLATDDDVAAEESENQSDDEHNFWDNMIFPI